VRVRLIYKFANQFDGVDVSRVRVGDAIDLSDQAAALLIAEGWAERIDDPASEPRRMNVLIVDDEPAIQQSLGSFLDLRGFVPFRAGTIEEALKIFGEQHVDALILDLSLPDPGGFAPSGLTLLAYLRSCPEYAQLPVLVFTGKILSANEEARIGQYRATLFYKPGPYAALVDGLRRSTVQLSAA
jgi:CheY-like chemotaxis protein